MGGPGIPMKLQIPLSLAKLTTFSTCGTSSVNPLTSLELLQDRPEHPCLHPAGGALPAAFVGEKDREAQSFFYHADPLGDKADDSAPEGRPRLLEGLVVQRDVDLVGQEERAGGTSREDGLETFAAPPRPRSPAASTSSSTPSGGSVSRALARAW